VPVAAIDIGTNTTRLIVAEVSGSSLEELERRSVITRLGEGVDQSGVLSPEGIERVRETLSDYREIVERLDAAPALAIATSAVRDASNGVLGDAGGPSFHVSLDIGAVRLTERYLHSDPPAPAELEHCATAVRELLVDRIPTGVLNAPTTAIGCAATITTIAALDQSLPAYERERIHGYSISRRAVHEQLARLAALPLSERRQVPALEPERAPVIVAGAIVCRELLDAFALEAIEASELDILDGAALLAAESSA